MNIPSAVADRPNRLRQFQFELRTLLIGIALLGAVGGYVAHEARIVRERRAWAASHIRLEYGPYGRTSPRHPDHAPTALRRWLGDKDYNTIYVSSEDVTAGAALFPEAEVIGGTPWGNDRWSMNASTTDRSSP